MTLTQNVRPGEGSAGGRPGLWPAEVEDALLNAFISNCLGVAGIRGGDTAAAREVPVQLQRLDFSDVVSCSTESRAHIALGRFRRHRHCCGHLANSRNSYLLPPLEILG